MAALQMMLAMPRLLVVAMLLMELLAVMPLLDGLVSRKRVPSLLVT